VGYSKTSIIPEDNSEISLRFEDGSIANIFYLSNGARSFGRERCEIHAEKRSAVWEDFRYVKIFKDIDLPKTYRSLIFTKKGYREELDIFFSEVKQTGLSDNEWLNGQLDASLAAIKAKNELFMG